MMWVVVRRRDSESWPEIVSKEFRLPTHAREFAKAQSEKELNVEFIVCRVEAEATYSSQIVTTRNEAKK